MKYYGDTEKNRLELVYDVDINDVTNEAIAEGYLNKKGMLFEFIMKRLSLGYDISEFPCSYKNCSSFKKKKFNNEIYYIGTEKLQIGGERYRVWKKHARIENDKTFRWKENQKYGTKETVIIQGNFEFTCIAKADGDAIVDVRYTKCDNKHRNKVTITRIEVYDASNEEILNAIDEWKKTFAAEMNDKKATIKLVA